MKTLFAREGQVYCFECGAEFLPDEELKPGEYVVATHCPNGCNRGAWLHRDRDADYCIPVQTRDIEDRYQ